MDKLILFTDGSVHTQLKIGYGAYLAVYGSDFSVDSLKSMVKVKRFENTSSTKLELQTLIWALGEIEGRKVVVYTDSQNIIELPRRRNRLEERDYQSSKNKLLKS